MSRLHQRLLAAILFAGLAFAAPAGAADALFASAPLDPDLRSGDPLALVPALGVPGYAPETVLAQRAVTRDLGRAPATPDAATGPQYTYVDVRGWKSPAAASGMSLVVPGTGELYAGSKTGYVFLGVEAVAVAAYVKYRNDSHDKRDQYFAYVGDPTQSASRFSFSRLSGSVSADDLARLKSIYASDPHEFYDIVTTDDAYAAGWSDPTVGGTQARTTADGFRSDVNSLSRRSRLGLFVALANHVVSTVDALRLARLNNVTLTQNLSLKIKLRPGAHQSYGLTLVQKF